MGLGKHIASAQQVIDDQEKEPETVAVDVYEVAISNINFADPEKDQKAHLVSFEIICGAITKEKHAGAVIKEYFGDPDLVDEEKAKWHAERLFLLCVAAGIYSQADLEAGKEPALDILEDKQLVIRTRHEKNKDGKVYAKLDFKCMYPANDERVPDLIERTKKKLAGESSDKKKTERKSMASF